MGLQVGVVGTGAFAQSFIPLFKAHPQVERVVLCDLDGDKRALAAARFEISDTSTSLDALCDIRRGRRVPLYPELASRLPRPSRLWKPENTCIRPCLRGSASAEIENLVAAARSSGAVYMLGETSYYYPGRAVLPGTVRAGRFWPDRLRPGGILP